MYAFVLFLSHLLFMAQIKWGLLINLHKVSLASHTMSASALMMKYADNTLVLDKRSRQEVHRLAHCFIAFQQIIATEFITARKSQPILFHYSSDETPLATTKELRIKVHDWTFTRCDKGKDAWLIQRGFLADIAGHVISILDRPMIMENKQAPTHFMAYRQFMKTPREHGHIDIQIIHHVYDRAVKSSIEKLILKHHKFQMQQLMQEEGASKSFLADLLTWHSIVGCVNHDVHNALKWCASEFTMNKTTLKGAYITTSAARNGRRVLIKHVSEWMSQTSIVFEDWEGMGDAELKRYYEIIGIEPEIIGAFIDMQIRYSGGKMRVASHVQHSSTPVSEEIIKLLMYAWHFDTFTDSRWMTLARSSRNLLRSLTLGLEDYVKWITMKKYSIYHLQGISKFCSADVKSLITILAMSAPVADGALAITMEDDRLPLIASSIMANMEKESNVLADTPRIIFHNIVMCVDHFDFTVDDLMTHAIKACVKIIGYLRGKIRPALREPYSLLDDDLPMNIDSDGNLTSMETRLMKFAQTPEPIIEGSLAWKVWKLLTLNYNIISLTQAMLLLKKVAWSANITEQGHAAASMVMKKTWSMYIRNDARSIIDPISTSIVWQDQG